MERQTPCINFKLVLKFAASFLEYFHRLSGLVYFGQLLQADM